MYIYTEQNELYITTVWNASKNVFNSCKKKCTKNTQNYLYLVIIDMQRISTLHFFHNKAQRSTNTNPVVHAQVT